MRGDRPQDAIAMVAIALVLAALAVARHAGDWLDALVTVVPSGGTFPVRTRLQMR